MTREHTRSAATIRVLLGGMAVWQADVLRELLDAASQLHIVGVMANAADTVAAAAALTPDVVLLNFAVRRQGVLETTRRLRVAAPHSQIVLLGDDDDPAYSDAARDAGADDYLPWLSSRTRLLAAVHGCGRGAHRMAQPAGLVASAGH